MDTKVDHFTPLALHVRGKKISQRVSIAYDILGVVASTVLVDNISAESTVFALEVLFCSEVVTASKSW